MPAEVAGAAGHPGGVPPWWATATPTPADVARRLEDLADAVASQRLEGLEPDPATVAELRRVALGGRTIDDVLAGIHARLALPVAPPSADGVGGG